MRNTSRKRIGIMIKNYRKILFNAAFYTPSFPYISRSVKYVNLIGMTS